MKFLHRPEFIVFTSVAGALAAHADANLPKGAVWVLRDAAGANRQTGYVKADGTLYPHPLVGYELGAADLGALTWTVTDGDAADVTADSSGLTVSAGASYVATATGVKCTSLTHTGPIIWQAQINLTAIDTVTADMIAVSGWMNTAGTDDWYGCGWGYDTAWRALSWAQDYNGGAPVETDLTTAVDIGAYTAGGVFSNAFIAKTGSIMWGSHNMADAATGTLRVTAGAVLTLTNVASPSEDFQPFFYVAAPGGDLTARLVSLKIAQADWFGFW